MAWAGRDLPFPGGSLQKWVRREVAGNGMAGGDVSDLQRWLHWGGGMGGSWAQCFRFQHLLLLSRLGGDDSLPCFSWK